MTNKRDIFDYISEQMTTTTEAISAEFDENVAEMQQTLEEMAETDAIGLTSSGRYWLIPGADDLTDEGIEAMAYDAFGLPSEALTEPVTQEPTPPVAVVPQNRSEGVSGPYLHPDRARENFSAHAEHATSEQGRAWAKGKLDALASV